jgi:hypothetical protein
MGVVKLDDDLHQVIKDNLNKLDFKIEYRDAKGVVDKAVYKFLLEINAIKKRK